jgi:hypothetical protein
MLLPCDESIISVNFATNAREEESSYDIKFF